MTWSTSWSVIFSFTSSRSFFRHLGQSTAFISATLSCTWIPSWATYGVTSPGSDLVTRSTATSSRCLAFA